MLKDPLYRTAAILVVLAAYVLIREAILGDPEADDAKGSASISATTANMALLKQYRLGDYSLEIPAPYVLHVAAGLGKTEHIVLGFNYPEASPVEPSERNRTGLGEKVKVTLHPKATCQQEAACDDHSFLQYKKRLMGDGYRMGLEIPEIPTVEEAEFQRFDITYKEEAYFMRVIGDVQRPTEWYYCKDAAEKSYCTTFYRVDDDLVAELTFDADLLAQHEALRTKTGEMLRSFIYYKKE